MRAQTSMIVAAAFLLVACAGGDDSSQSDSTPTPRDTGTVGAAGNPADSGMAGMDHSTMNMGAPAPAPTPSTPAAATGMAGMDHSTMAISPRQTGGASTRPATAPGGMAGMDHSQMDMGARSAPPRGTGRSSPGRASAATGGMAGMDHSTMPMSPARPGARSSTATPRAGAMAGMDHSAMAPTQPPVPDAAEQKLQRLVGELVQDSVVRARIQADSVLRNRWQDPEVRRILLGRP